LPKDPIHIGSVLVNPPTSQSIIWTNMSSSFLGKMTGTPSITVEKKSGLHLSGGDKLSRFFLFDNAIGTRGPRGRGIMIGYDSDTILTSTKILLQYDSKIPDHWIYWQFIEPLAFLLNLKSGIFFVHSASFVLGTSAVLFGWTHIGKTQTILKFIESGAKILSDDWTGFSQRGLIGYTGLVKLSTSNIANYPHLENLGMKISNNRLISMDTLGAEKIESSVVDLIFDIRRYEGTGAKLLESNKAHLKMRMISTFAYMIQHYIGEAVSASQYGYEGEQPEVGTYINIMGEEILQPVLDVSRTFDLICGYGSEESLVSEIKRCLAIGT